MTWSKDTPVRLICNVIHCSRHPYAHYDKVTVSPKHALFASGSALVLVHLTNAKTAEEVKTTTVKIRPWSFTSLVLLMDYIFFATPTDGLVGFYLPELLAEKSGDIAMDLDSSTCLRMHYAREQEVKRNSERFACYEHPRARLTSAKQMSITISWTEDIIRGKQFVLDVSTPSRPIIAAVRDLEPPDTASISEISEVTFEFLGQSGCVQSLRALSISRYGNGGDPYLLYHLDEKLRLGRLPTIQNIPAEVFWKTVVAYDGFSNTFAYLHLDTGEIEIMAPKLR